MVNILQKKNGMSIVGQGGKIMLFALPSLIAAILVHTYFPHISALPKSVSFIKAVGYLLLPPGLILWGAAVIQLLTGFYRGRLVTTGAYGVVRNRSPGVVGCLRAIRDYGSDSERSLEWRPWS